MRRDRRSEAFVLELSRSHPAGVICGQATGENRREILRCAQDDEFEEEHRQECVQSHDILYRALSGHPLHSAGE
jgi:hypothetical protein